MKNKFTFVMLLMLALVSVQSLKAAELRGQALYQGDSARPIGYVMVTLKNIDNNSVQTFKTGADGTYTFTNLVAGNYIVTGTTNIASKGATYYDAMLLFLHLVGRLEFTPLQMLAADVNGSGNVNWQDYTLFLKNLLLGKPFPVDPWRFETKSIKLTDMKGTEYNPKGIGGTCSGDVGGTFVPTANTTPAVPVAQEGEISVSSGESFTTEIITRNPLSITGAGLIINYPSELLDIQSVEFKGTGYEYNIENGQIRVIWGDPNTQPVNFNAGEAFITIRGTSTSAFGEGMTANLNMDKNTSLVNASLQNESKLNFASPLIKFGKSALKLSNYPNPFKNSTKLNIYVPESGNATIEVYGTNGQLVKRISAGQLNAGYQEYTLEASQLAKGYYICKVRIQAKTSEYNNSLRLLKAE